MNSVAPLLFLPTLHPDTLPLALPAPLADVALHLWPGQPGMPANGYWLPADYPFSSAQAAACLADMQAMSEAALSGVPLQALAARDARPEALRQQTEERALAHFAASGEAAPLLPEAQDLTLLRTAAQKTLLWAWLLEERSRELRDLTRGYCAGNARLADALGVEYDDEALPGLSALHGGLEEDQGILPPWRLVLENAAFFLPENGTLLCNSAAMRDEVCDTLPLLPLDAPLLTSLHIDEAAAGDMRYAQCPVWRLLGRSQPRAQSPWLDVEIRCIFPGARA